MAEAMKVRLVRCPKCENLLQEIPNVPVYKCGGCGAVLQAKKQSSSTSNGSLEKSDEESNSVSSVKLKSLPEKRGDLNPSETSEISDRESDGVELGMREKVKIFPEKETCSNMKNDPSSTYFQRNATQETGYGDKYRHFSKDPVDDHDREKQIRVNIERETGEFEHQMGISSGYRREEQLPDYNLRERDRTTAYRRTRRAIVDDVNFSGYSTYPDEGPSNYQQTSSSYGNGGLINTQNNMDGFDRVELLEEDRVELLRKLDELKEQLTRSCDVSEKSKERVLPVSCDGQNNWFPNSSSGSKQVFSQPFHMDEHIRKPPYVSNVHEPLIHGPGRDMQGFYNAQVHASNGRMLGRAPTQPWQDYPKRPSHGYLSGQFLDVDREQVSLYPHNNSLFYQPECACSHGCNQGWQVPGQGLPMIFPNRRFSEPPATNPMFYRFEDPHAFGPWDCNHRSANPPLNSRERQTQTRRKTNHDSEISGFGRGGVQKVSLAKRNGRRCLPIAGGAPFIACYNCFESLPLPRKLLLREKNQQKLRCGGCSTVISVLVESKKLVISVPTQTKEVPLEVNDGSVQVVKEGILHSHGHLNHSMNYYSDDCDNSASNFQSMDERLNSSESEKLQGLPSSSSSTFEDEGSPDSVIDRQDVSSSAELPMKTNETPLLLGSPLHEHYEHSDQLVNKLGKGNMSKRRDQEKIVFTKDTSRQNSEQDAMVATEIDVSFNEYLNTGTSQDSKEVTKEEHRPKNGKGGSDSFLVGLIKKSFKDFSRSNQTEENGGPNVFVNGQPIPERLVKKAEKQAGPIHPGDYWYDSRAGFWGVMDQPCLGIIPPFIEEFSYPMPKNCSSGDTGVFVNGRELHEYDLDLLSSRGLPTTIDKSYIIEISGRILDEDSGEELESLGKLAPTVERVKRGFGMFIPGVSA